MSDTPPIVPGTKVLDGIILGEPARIGNAWVWSDVRLLNNGIVAADGAEPIPHNNNPASPPGSSPEEDSLPGGSPTE